MLEPQPPVQFFAVRSDPVAVFLRFGEPDFQTLSETTILPSETTTPTPTPSKSIYVSYLCWKLCFGSKKHIYVEKTYHIRKVGGGGVRQGSEKKKASVGLFSTFRHPLGLEEEMT